MFSAILTPGYYSIEIGHSVFETILHFIWDPKGVILIFLWIKPKKFSLGR
jgi:hypothetical protein